MVEGEGGGVLSPTVSKEIPARSVRGGGNVTSRQTPFKILIIKKDRGSSANKVVCQRFK